MPAIRVAERSPSLRGANRSVFDLLRRYEHDSPVTPFGNRIAGPLVIANRLFNGASCFLDDTAEQFIVGLSNLFEFGFGRRPDVKSI